MVVKANINGEQYDLTKNTATGKWECVINAPTITSYNVNSGHYYPITVTATDDYGNSVSVDDSDASADIQTKLFVKEVTAPTVLSINPNNGSHIAVNTYSFSAEIKDEVSGSGINTSSVSFTLDGQDYSASCSGSDGTYTATMQNAPVLSDGEHTVSVVCSDNDGNTSSAFTSTFTVDTAAPILTITSPSTPESYTNNASCIVEGTTSDVTTSIVSLTMKFTNGSNVVTVDDIVIESDGSFSYTRDLDEGETTILITATDLVGKTSQATYVVNVNTSGIDIIEVDLSNAQVNVGGVCTISVEIDE